MLIYIINYNTLPITELHEFYIICLIHKFMHHKHLLPRIYHNYLFISQRIIKFIVIILEIKMIYIYTYIYIYISAVSHSFGSRAIYFKGCTLWNQLPVYLKSITSITTFKRKLKEFLHSCLTC